MRITNKGLEVRYGNSRPERAGCAGGRFGREPRIAIRALNLPGRVGLIPAPEGRTPCAR